MTTLLIGDFRLKQIQNTANSTATATNHQFLTDDNADCAWFADSVIKQIAKFNLIKANIVITLGFVDCLYSCCLNKLDITAIASNYKTLISELKENYPACNFYFCSVNPIK